MMVPDIPEEVEMKIKREHYMAKEALAENQVQQNKSKFTDFNCEASFFVTFYVVFYVVFLYSCTVTVYFSTCSLRYNLLCGIFLLGFGENHNSWW